MIVTTSIEIDAPARKAWDILTDLDKYSEWNPFTYKVRGKLEVGEQVVLSVAMGRQKTKQKLVVRRVEADSKPRVLVWSLAKERGLVLRGGRSQKIEELADGRCRYTSEERLEGLLSIIVGALFATKIQVGLDSVAAALKERAEAS